MTLLHLVSEQTMQNLLPLLALKPRTVVQVRSSDQRFHQAAENLKSGVAAIRQTPAYRDLAPEFFEVVIDEASPDVDRARGKVGEALSLWPGAVVNLTGGTKPMSIGAFLAAQYQCEPALYCDTQQRRFISVNEKRPLPKLPGFDEIAATLTVESALAAHGISLDKLRSVKPTEQQLAFARGLHARAAKADLAVLVSQVLPAEVNGFGWFDGVWMCDATFAMPLALALRQGVVTAAVARQNGEGRQTKMEELFTYLTSLEFRHRVEGVVETFKAMGEDLETEKRALQKHWGRREKQLQQAVMHTAMLYGSVQGIVGQAALPEIKILQLADSAGDQIENQKS